MKNLDFPFSAIVGQEKFKLALVLCLVDPNLGGVLAMGDKGTGKTTTVRALSNLMDGEKKDSFVNLPIGATEDRVLGSLKLEPLINEKKKVVEEGLLAKAHGGILFVDEVNLLDDYLMDAMLDAVATGGYFLERENISEWFPSRFVLVGTMNPEEGELRPQLLDRFGLSVEIKTPTNKEERKRIVKNRLAFDSDKKSFLENYKKEEAALANKIKVARQKLDEVSISNEILDYATNICIESGVEGIRADILLVKTASALCAFEERKQVSIDDIERVKEFVLNHRAKDGSNQSPSSKKDSSNTESEKKNPRILENPLEILETQN